MRFGLLILFLVFSISVFANKPILMSDERKHADVISIEEYNDFLNLEKELCQKPNPVFTLFKKKQRLNKKITAAALAFPFPFGIVGLHRIYLGTKPYVPVAYIGTAGGVFGILPLIDFFKISFDKDLTQYQNNGKVFMWIKE